MNRLQSRSSATITVGYEDEFKQETNSAEDSKILGVFSSINYLLSVIIGIGAFATPVSNHPPETSHTHTVAFRVT